MEEPMLEHARASTLNVADRVAVTEAEGPGKRYALWVQGCPLRCPGCCNQHMLEFRDKEYVTVEQIASEIATSRRENGIEGVTFLGGEPFSQPEGLGELARLVQCMGLSVMVFSGYTLEQLQRRPAAASLLNNIDLLVDGPYLQEQAVSNRRYIGSANQRVHFLTDRYEDGWDRGSNTIELRVVDGALQVNGFPTSELQQWLDGLSDVQ